jgi:hypothetical protein
MKTIGVKASGAMMLHDRRWMPTPLGFLPHPGHDEGAAMRGDRRDDCAYAHVNGDAFGVLAHPFWHWGKTKS